MTHTCHHPACRIAVPPRLLACKPHWLELPRALRAEVWRTYRRGQERDKRPSDDYLAARRACDAWWKANAPHTEACA